MELFDHAEPVYRPLAERLRPLTLKEFVGQRHVIGEGKLLNSLILKDELPSLIFWGPPGVGKTTLARIIAKVTTRRFETLSATTSGIKEVKELIAKASEDLKFRGTRTILFIDEIHRFNKAQQDAFLPHVEAGTITLIGATTENPSFEVNAALMSRCQVVVLNPLSEEDLAEILRRALSAQCRPEMLSGDAQKLLIANSYGDARYLINMVEDLLVIFPEGKAMGADVVGEKILRRAALYDKKAEHHYNVISAFIKSMRGSDADAAVYYLARMLEAGEDPLFIARRMVIFASEDIGNADPRAVQVAVACMQSYDFVGKVEGWIPLAQCATYLAMAPKGNASYAAYKKAKSDVERYGPLDVPLHLRNAPTNLMKDIGYGEGYKYPHDDYATAADQQYLPDALKGRRYYVPT